MTNDPTHRRPATPGRRGVLAAAAAGALTVAGGAVVAGTPTAHARPAGTTPEIPAEYVLPGDRAFPSGHAYHAPSGHLYVGSAADGTLYRGHVTRPRLHPWSPDGADGRSTTSGMTADSAGRLYVGGADTGTLRIYDMASGGMLARLEGVSDGFVNEVTVARDGVAYVTDSFRPVVYRVLHDNGRWRMESWLDVSDSPIDWIDGRHNLNGILAVGGHLLTVNSSTGQLWRLDQRTGAAREVDLGGHSLPNGDGLAWHDGHLYVVQGNINNSPGLVPQVAVLRMSSDLTRGRYTARLVPPGGFLHPSSVTLALAYGRVNVVNSQYNRWIDGLPPESLPFTVSSIPLTDATPV